MVSKHLKYSNDSKLLREADCFTGTHVLFRNTFCYKQCKLDLQLFLCEKLFEYTYHPFHLLIRKFKYFKEILETVFFLI